MESLSPSDIPEITPGKKPRTAPPPVAPAPAPIEEVPQNVERAATSLEWTDEFADQVIFYAVTSPLLKDFPDTIDEGVFGSDSGEAQTQSPRQKIVSKILFHLKKYGEFPGIPTMNLLVKKEVKIAGKIIGPAIERAWDEILEYGTAHPVPYDEFTAQYRAMLSVKHDFQLLTRHAVVYRRITEAGVTYSTEISDAKQPHTDRYERLMAGLGGTREWLAVIAACDFNPEPVKWLIEGFLQQGEGYCNLSGQFGAGKSLLMMEGIKAVLNGTPFMGQPEFATRQGRVSLFQIDDGPNRIGRRLKALGIDKHPLLEIVDPKRIREAQAAGKLEEMLRGYIRRHRRSPELTPVLIVVDSLSELIPTTPGAGNDASSMRPILDLLNAISMETGACVWLACHTRKDGKSISGSQMIENAAKASYRLEAALPPYDANGPVQDNGDRYLLTVKNKDGEGKPVWKLHLNAPGDWIWYGSKGVKERQDLEARVIEFLSQDGEGVFKGEVFNAQGKRSIEEIKQGLNVTLEQTQAVLAAMKEKGTVQNLRMKRRGGMKSEKPVWVWQLPPTLDEVKQRVKDAMADRKGTLPDDESILEFLKEDDEEWVE